ncbi:hypothetical protein BaRGS_00021550 [Batillaria attramentaria]|uniref:Uncharacterized protein n=1 Tax=Batillaria attramentaria TaxID=370345 RepID=A0ABD0KJB5_9CAEN
MWRSLYVCGGDTCIKTTEQNISQDDCLGCPVLVASLFLFMCSEGYGIGVFFDTFQDHFGSGNADTAWLVAAQFGTMCIVGTCRTILTHVCKKVSTLSVCDNL